MNASYRICCLYDAYGWAYHKRCLALQKHAPEDFAVDLACGMDNEATTGQYDLILQLCYSRTPELFHCCRHMSKHTRIVAGFNVGWAEHAQRWFPSVHRRAHHVIVNSKATWEMLGRPERTSWISNGVDLEMYRRTMSAEQRTPTALFMGSEFHTQKHYDTKNWWSILQPLKARLADVGMRADFRRVNSVLTRANAKKVLIRAEGYMLERELVKWYNTGRVYVVASNSEGTPNPALEAAACGNVVVATRVGNMPELIEHGVNGELVECNIDAIFAAVCRCADRYEEMSAAMLERIQAWGWRERAGQYFDLFRRLIEEYRRT